MSYIINVIISFRSRTLRRFWAKGQERVIAAEIRGRVTQVLTLLDSAEQPQELDLPGLYLHGMSGRLAGHWSVRITANLRITFRFEGVDVADVNMLDYH